MSWNLSKSAGWALLAAAVLLLGFMRQLDLLVIVVPLAVVTGYFAARRTSGRSSGQRRI